MVDRIRTLLQARQLSPTHFADAIGVARPIVSHILSGRNKPSLEVVQKILTAFPDLSMAWLLNGTEPMLTTVVADAEPTVVPAPVPVAPAPTVPKPASRARRPVVEVSSAAPVPPEAAIPAQQVPIISSLADSVASMGHGIAPDIAQPASPVPPAAVPLLPPVASAPLPVAPIAPPVAPTPAPMPSAAAAFAVPGKAIRRIVIFYQDGSFADYQPE